MINIPFNPMLKKSQFKTPIDATVIIKCNTSITFSILVLFVLTVISYISVWQLFDEALILKDKETIQQIKNFSFVSGILSFAILFFTSYKPTLSPILAPVYALLSGVFIGGLSLTAEMKFPGIAILTSELTLLVFIVMYIGYKLGLIQVTQKYKAIVYGLIGTISLLYLFSFIFMFVDIKLPLLHDAGIGGVAWGIFITAIAAFHLVIDIDKIEQADKNLPGFMNWRIALGLMVALIWLYFTMLRLLTRINSLKNYN